MIGYLEGRNRYLFKDADPTLAWGTEENQKKIGDAKNITSETCELLLTGGRMFMESEECSWLLSRFKSQIIIQINNCTNTRYILGK